MGIIRRQAYGVLRAGEASARRRDREYARQRERDAAAREAELAQARRYVKGRCDDLAAAVLKSYGAQSSFRMVELIVANADYELILARDYRNAFIKHLTAKYTTGSRAERKVVRSLVRDQIGRAKQKNREVLDRTRAERDLGDERRTRTREAFLADAGVGTAGTTARVTPPKRSGAPATDPEPLDKSRPDAGWYIDPHDSHLWRYWDGTAWTEHRSARLADASDEQQRNWDAEGLTQAATVDDARKLNSFDGEK